MDDIKQKTVVIIPARKDSKGLPGKNVRILHGRPLFRHTLDLALSIFPSQNICLSTDDGVIQQEAQNLCLVDKRPKELAQDNTAMKDVLIHCIQKFPHLEYGLLLQPTSPFRKPIHIIESMALMEIDSKPEGVFSVSVSKHIPGYSLFELNETGALEMSPISVSGRQQAPEWLCLNGSIYWFRLDIFRQKKSLSALNPVLPYRMGFPESLDIDTLEDWRLAEYFASQY